MLSLSFTTKPPLPSFKSNSIPNPNYSSPSKFPSSPFSFQSLPTTTPSSSSSSSSSSSHIPIINVDPTLPPNLKRIVDLFQSAPDSRLKFEEIMHYAKRLPILPQEFRTDDNKVGSACPSGAWVRAYPDPNDPSIVRFDAYSHSETARGLMAILVLGLSGEAISVISRVSPDFTTLLGLGEGLISQSRKDGFLSILKSMQVKALQVTAGSGSGGQDEVLEGETASLGGNASGFEGNSEMNEVLVANFDGQDEVLMVEKFPSSGVNGGRRDRIMEILERELNPVELVVEDISHLHGGNAGENHFSVRVVSKEFEGKSAVKRVRFVHELLREELESRYSVVAMTPSEV